MKLRPLAALLAVIGVALLLVLFLIYAAQDRAQTQDLAGLSNVEATESRPTVVPLPPPAPTRAIREWRWVKPGFGGRPAITLTQGTEHFVYYDWSVGCDAPGQRQVPMIWGRTTFYTDHVSLSRLFDGPCNDGRPLLFLNEPAKVEQANISPIEAAHMFYTMTRGATWRYERWHGPIYAGGNVAEERGWDAEFVRQFARLYNGNRQAIPEIAGWAVHLYGNYEYGPAAGDPQVVWTEDIPPDEIPAVVDRSMSELDEYLQERRAEGNATSLAVTEFGLLQASRWHEPRTYYYTTTAHFMDEYVQRFDRRPEIQAWFWFISVGAEDEFLDTNVMVDANGRLTPNGLQWRELARARQRGD